MTIDPQALAEETEEIIRSIDAAEEQLRETTEKARSQINEDFKVIDETFATLAPEESANEPQ